MNKHFQIDIPVYRLDDLEILFPDAYAQAFERLAKRNETAFWEAAYFDLFHDFFNERNQSNLRGEANHFGTKITAQGPLNVPKEIQTTWLRDFGANLQTVDVSISTDGVTFHSWPSDEYAAKITVSGMGPLIDYCVNLLTEFKELAFVEAQNVRKHDAIHLEEREEGSLFDKYGFFRIHEWELKKQNQSDE